MFIPATGLCVLNIPKCGTNTLNAAIERTYKSRALPNHYTLAEMVEQVQKRGLGKPVEALAVIRDPVHRFLSALNYEFGDNGEPLDRAIDRAIYQRRTIAHKPQRDFLDHDLPVMLVPFERMDLALAKIGYCGKPIHENRSIRRWGVEDLAHRLDEIREFVAGDMPLRREALEAV